MDARGNELFSYKIPDQYLKKQKVIKLLEVWQLLLMKRKEQRIHKCCYHNAKKEKIANTIELLSKL